MNISEVKNLPDDSWVEQTVVGTISSAKNIKTKNGKDMGVAKLGDDNDTIDLQSFDKSFTSYDGKTVELSGKGIKKETYNGYAKLKVGKGVNIDVTGGAATATPSTGSDRPLPVTRAKQHDDNDFVPQTLTYMMGAAVAYAVAMYKAREKAVAIIRGEGK